MRAHTAFFAALALGVVAQTACSGRSKDREYKLQGQILSIASDHKEASIKHEEISGFMAAMTMPYKVRDAKELADLAPGDLITSTLVIVSNAPLEKAPAEAPMPPASSGFELLKNGEAVPNGAFVDENGKPRTLADFRGSVVIVTFMYTACPMPTFCPLMDRHFATIQERLKAKDHSPRAHLLSVSIDPATDTPAVLKRHAEKLKADPRLWTFLTGQRDDLDRWSKRLGMSVSRAMNDQKDIAHNLRTVLIDRHGNLVRTYTGNEWTPEQVLADAQAMVGVD
jgi:protein SCO1